MASSFNRWLCSASGAAVLASFVACGGASDPGLFDAPSGAGRPGSTGHAGAANQAGAPTQGGASAAGAPNDGESGEQRRQRGGASEGGSPSSAGSSSGGSAAAGSNNAGTGGVAQAGAANGGSAGAGAVTSAGAANGGSAGGGERDCQALLTKANQQLAAAQACNLYMNSLSCTASVATPCGCEVPVNRQEGTETKAYLATLDALQQKKCVQACPAIACAPLTRASCRASGIGSSAGKCTTSYATTF